VVEWRESKGLERSKRVRKGLKMADANTIQGRRNKIFQSLYRVPEDRLREIEERREGGE